MTDPTRKKPQAFATGRLEEFDRTWSRQNLATGLTAFHVPTPHDDHFYLGLLIRGGSRHETPATSGVSHLLEHMMFRGCSRYPNFVDLARAFEWLGGEWNAATGHEHTEYWLSGTRATAEESIDLFSEFLENPLYKDLEIERKIILRELDGELNEFGHSTDLEFHMSGLLWPGSSLARPILGTKETIGSIDLSAMKSHRDHYYVPQNMALCVVGGRETGAFLKTVERFFASHRSAFSSTQRPPTPGATDFMGPAVKWVENSDNEYEIQVSFRCEGEWSEDSYVYEIIERILSDGFCSRLSSRIREELGLVYDIDADTSLSSDTGCLDITASVEGEQLDHFFHELYALLRRLREDGPTAEELDRAILRSVIDLELAPSEPEEWASRLCWAHLSGRSVSLVRDRETILSISRERVAGILDWLFRPKNAGVVILGPKADGLEDKMKKALVDGLG